MSRADAAHALQQIEVLHRYPTRRLLDAAIGIAKPRRSTGNDLPIDVHLKCPFPSARICGPMGTMNAPDHPRQVEFLRDVVQLASDRSRGSTFSGSGP